MDTSIPDEFQLIPSSIHIQSVWASDMSRPPAKSMNAVVYSGYARRPEGVPGERNVVLDIDTVSRKFERA